MREGRECMQDRRGRGRLVGERGNEGFDSRKQAGKQTKGRREKEKDLIVQ